MSLIHYTLVGHFDPRAVHYDLAVARPVDEARISRLLTEYPARVGEFVSVVDGYVLCQWAPAGGLMELVHEFAYRLASEEGCLAVENQRVVGFPPEAVAAQNTEWERLLTGQRQTTSGVAPDSVMPFVSGSS